MAQVAKIPSFVAATVSALDEAFPGSQIDVERIGRTRNYRIAVVWPNFKRMGHPQRQNRGWDIAERVLSPQEILRIGMILTLTPDELPE